MAAAAAAAAASLLRHMALGMLLASAHVQQACTHRSSQQHPQTHTPDTHQLLARPAHSSAIQPACTCLPPIPTQHADACRAGRQHHSRLPRALRPLPSAGASVATVAATIGRGRGRVAGHWSRLWLWSRCRGCRRGAATCGVGIGRQVLQCSSFQETTPVMVGSYGTTQQSIPCAAIKHAEPGHAAAASFQVKGPSSSAACPRHHTCAGATSQAMPSCTRLALHHQQLTISGASRQALPVPVVDSAAGGGLGAAQLGVCSVGLVATTEAAALGVDLHLRPAAGRRAMSLLLHSAVNLAMVERG
jgi:hypothetical protein